MEEIPDINLCNEFVHRARVTQAWFKFINPFTNKPIVKGSATYNKILKKCQGVRFGSLVIERKKPKQEIEFSDSETEEEQHEEPEQEDETEADEKIFEYVEEKEEPTKLKNNLSSELDDLSRILEKTKIKSPIRSPIMSSSRSSGSLSISDINKDFKKLSIESPLFLSSSNSPRKLDLRLSKTPSPLRSPPSFSQKTLSASPLPIKSKSKSKSPSPKERIKVMNGKEVLYSYSPDQTLPLSFPLRSRSTSPVPVPATSPVPVPVSVTSAGRVSKKLSSSSSSSSPFQYAMKQQQKQKELQAKQQKSLGKSPSRSPEMISAPKFVGSTVISSPKVVSKKKIESPKVIQRIPPVKTTSIKKKKEKSPSPPYYPIKVPSKTKYIPKKDVLLDTNKCKQLIELGETLQEGEKIKNPFTNKMIVKGKGTYQKLVKDCQKFIRQYVEEEPKVEEFDLEDILSFDF